MLFDGDVFDDILLRLLFGVGDDGHDGVFACRESRVSVFGLPVVDVPVDPADLAAVVEQTSMTGVSCVYPSSGTQMRTLL